MTKPAEVHGVAERSDMSPAYAILLLVALLGIAGGLWALMKSKSNRARRESSDECEHDWQMDGQTMTAVRWTCTKCGKSMFR